MTTNASVISSRSNATHMVYEAPNHPLSAITLESELTASLESGDVARDALVREHLPLVHHLARQLRGHLPRHVDIDDLVSAGMLGLLDACRMFNSDRNVKFRTYAQIRVRGAMLDSLRSMDRASRRLRRQGKATSEAVRALTASLNRTPNDGEIAQAMGISLQSYHSLQGDLARVDCWSHETGNGRYTDEEVLNNLPASSAESPFASCLSHELQDRLAAAIEGLPERERLVITLYYYEHLTMAEIGEVLGLVMSRISQIHGSAICRLRIALAALERRARHTHKGSTPLIRETARPSREYN